ncbi:hypothetical protein LAUMK22_05664 [Mycobacterium kansasii]|nr:hypothetical protein LAUMK22_05664 [Mycobacterium kansasii]VAZ64583.1 hypothetical protein LAUMK40_00701 [Mycobacterium kansasii]
MTAVAAVGGETTARLAGRAHTAATTGAAGTAATPVAEQPGAAADAAVTTRPADSAVLGSRTCPADPAGSADPAGPTLTEQPRGATGPTVAAHTACGTDQTGDTCAAGATRPARAEQEPGAAAGAARPAGSALAADAAVADQAGGSTGAADCSQVGARPAVAAVAVQESAGPAGGSHAVDGGPVGAVADQRATQQRLGGRVDHSQQDVCHGGGFGGNVRIRARQQGVGELVVECRRLPGHYLVVLRVLGKQRRDGGRYLVSRSAGHIRRRGGRRRIPVGQQRADTVHIGGHRGHDFR